MVPMGQFRIRVAVVWLDLREDSYFVLETSTGRGGATRVYKLQHAKPP